MRDRLSRVLLVVVAIAAPACAGDTPAPADSGRSSGGEEAAADLGGPPISLEFVADFNIPRGAFAEGFGDADLGGLSGAFYDTGRDELLAVSDGRDRNLYFTFEIELGAERLALRPGAAHELDRGTPDAPIVDLEGLAADVSDSLWVSTEGRAADNVRTAPAVVEFSRRGEVLRRLPVPRKFVPEEEGPQTRGVRDNLGFESLTITPDGQRLITATESALVQDGPEADFEHGTVVRILEYRIDAEEVGPPREFAYPLRRLPRVEFDVGIRVNGLVELLALGDGTFLGLERAFLQRDENGGLNRIRIFFVDLAGATEISDRTGLVHDVVDVDDVHADGSSASAASSLVTARKTLVLDLDTIVDRLDPEYPRLDNFEAMCFGPELADGSRSLLLISDDNFSTTQRTAVLLFRIVENG